MIKIEYSKITDLPYIMSYIGKNFVRKKHILSKNKSLVDWLYFNKSKKRYNFIIAKKNKKIIGLLGFIKNSNYQTTRLKDVVWISPWHTLEKNKTSFSGIEFINFLLKKNKKNILGTIGLNEIASKIFSLLGFKVGNLNHFYLANPTLKKFNVCKIKIKSKIKKFKENRYKISFEKKLKFRISKKKRNALEKKYQKKLNYFLYKYSKNPFYNYRYLIIKKNNQNLGFFVARESVWKKSKVLRLVDYYGSINFLKYIGKELQNLVILKGYEYIDFYNHGIDKKILFKCGFKLNDKRENIIPNYFEPFEKKNIKLGFAIWPKKSKLLIFKADCDQDRPSVTKVS